MANAVNKLGSEVSLGEEEKFALDTQRAKDQATEQYGIQSESQSIIDKQQEDEARRRAEIMEQNQKYLAGAL